MAEVDNSQAVVAVGQVQSSLPAPQLDVLDTQTKAIGLIVPPHDIRVIIDKTADFVAANGTAFEQKILAQPKNVKFNFLHDTDPYHKYYQFKIVEARDGPEAAAAAFASANTAATQAGAPKPAIEEPMAPPPTQELRKPDEEKYTAHVPAGLSAKELDFIKLTAQFVARNGAEFLNGLKSREENKREFMFLKETHSLNTFFKRLTDAYSCVLLDSKEALKQLHADVEDSSAVLQRCLQRLEWVRVKQSEADEVRAEKERERELMMLIDWHDFAVVRTIEFDAAEDLSALGPPLTKQLVMQMNKASGADAGEPQDMEMQDAAPQDGVAGGDNGEAMDAEESALIAAGQQDLAPPLPSVPDSAAGQVVVAADDDDQPVKVVKDYRRTATGQDYDPAKYVVSPITGELVPLAEMQEHMRINLIDPKWKDQREAMLAKIKETTKASDTEIMSNLTRLAGLRPDVFGNTKQLGEAIVDKAPTALPRDGPAAPRPMAAGKRGQPVLAPLPAAPAGASMPPPPAAPLQGGAWRGAEGAMQPPAGLPPQTLPRPPGQPPSSAPQPPTQMPPPPLPPQPLPDPKRQKTS